ncbi:MAG: chemotaxis protein CheW [Desulfovibrionales bacterium]
MQTAAFEAETRDALTELAGKYLTFRLGEEDFGLRILKVQEIIGMQEITGTEPLRGNRLPLSLCLFNLKISFLI